MNYLLLFFSCMCNGLKSVFAKKSNTYINEVHNIYTYNFYMFLIAFLITLVMGVWSLGTVSVQTVAMAVLYGLLLVFAQVFLIKAMNIGGVMISTLVYSCAFLIPIFASAFVYNESVTIPQIVGVILIVVSFVISVEQFEKGTAKWFLFAFAAFICNGTLAFTQKVFRMSDFGGEQNAFMIISFFVGAVVMFFIMPKKGMTLPSQGFLKTALGSGITIGLVNIINVYISGVLPAIIVFPSVNGGGIIVSAIFARILISEKISTRKMIGILIGVTAICLIAI